MHCSVKLLFVVSLLSPMLHAKTVKIYAAASLTNAVTDIAKLYKKQNPKIKSPIHGTLNIKIVPFLGHITIYIIIIYINIIIYKYKYIIIYNIIINIYIYINIYNNI